MNNLQSTALTGALVLSALAACSTPNDSVLSVREDEAISANATSTRPPRGKSLIVEGDTRLKAGEHYLPALGEDGQKGVVVLEGLSGVTLDLSGVVLRGLPEDSAPDASFGTGIILRNCEDVELLGGEARGYRVALLIESSRDIVVDGFGVTRGYASALEGTAASSQRSDQLELSSSGDDWLRKYGAGIFVVDSSGVSVRNCKVRESQNGLVSVRSGGCSFADNDFSYLSGWGIALDESEGNEVHGNRCDFVTRGSSLAQGAESLGAAGLLLVRGSSDNSIVGNSAVRCSVGALVLGDASRELRSNHFARNDFSHASWRSMRLEHVSDSWLFDNDALGEAGGGFELERCARLAISGNRIEHVFGAGLALFESETCLVEGNSLRDCDQALDVSGGSGHSIRSNSFEDNLQDLVLEDCSELGLAQNDFSEESPDVHLTDLRGLGAADITAREAWTTLADGEGQLPSGRARNVGFSELAGAASVDLTAGRSWSESNNRLDARGSGSDAGALILGEFTPWDPAGGALPPRENAGLGLMGDVSWDATWFAWNEESDPRGDLERWRALRYEPLLRARVGAWTQPWGGSERAREDVGTERFGLIATGEVYVTRAGKYELGTLSDDGLRVSVDGKVVYESWTWHPALRETTELELTVGRHELELEYFQIDGAAELTLELDRASE